MKKALFITALYLFTAQSIYSQKRTSITGFIENLKDSSVNVHLKIIDGTFAINTMQDYYFETKNGEFNFDFTLKKTSTATLYINNKLAFVPGTFSILINPGDSLNFSISDIKKLGLGNMKISGVGADKINLVKEVVETVMVGYLFKKSYNKQTITEKYLQVDRSLDIIDSMFNIQNNSNSRDFRLAKAQLVDQSLDMILYYSVKNYSDSVAILFDDLIKSKKRINPLLNSTSINYFGGNNILPNYLYLINIDKIIEKKSNFRYDYPEEYSLLVVKEFGHVPVIRDYMLSDISINIFRDKWDSNISENMYNYYIANTDKENPYYNKVIKEYEYVQNFLKPGKAFYNFSLPDTTGTIHHLEDFKGKVVVLDFWFTGCSGCKAITPLLEEVEESMKGNNIQFISVNVDKKSSWIKGIGKYSSNHSLQLYTEDQRFDHPIIKFAKVNTYPTLIVLDKEGNIVGIPPRPYEDIVGFKHFITTLLQ